MIQKLLRKYRRKVFRRIKRLFRDKSFLLAAAILIVAAGTIIYSTAMQNTRPTVDTATLQPLMNLIARAESSGNYNAYFGHGDNTTINFTDMTIAAVLNWQHSYVAQGSPSSAVGKYQIVDTTLSGLIRQLGIDPDKQTFDPATQDRLATALIIRRGADDYINKDLTRDDFAANLAREWAGLPKITQPNPQQSYYASDGLNKSRVSVDEVLNAITPIQSK